jgi:hypothetical protein
MLNLRLLLLLLLLMQYLLPAQAVLRRLNGWGDSSASSWRRER